MKAYLKNYRQAPRKVRLLADAIRGKRVSDVLTELSFMPHKAATPLKKLVESAVANAKQNDANKTADTLMLKTITVDKGRTIVRYMPRAFGRAAPINRESSHVTVVLSEVDSVDKTTAAVAASDPKTKKPVAKKNVAKTA